VTRITLDLKSKVPIYIQIRDQLRLLIATGELKDGSQMPPVRDLATELLINPNTVSKAYQELEREGYIETRRGMGTFVSEQSGPSTDDRDLDAGLGRTKDYLTTMLGLGFTPDEIVGMIKNLIEK
jgi:GntR family transcriptional regulator